MLKQFQMVWPCWLVDWVTSWLAGKVAEWLTVWVGLSRIGWVVNNNTLELMMNHKRVMCAEYYENTATPQT